MLFMRMGSILILVILVVGIIASFLLTQNQTAYNCALKEVFSLGYNIPTTCSNLEIYDWIVAIVILITSLIAVNSITLGRSDLGVWSMGILGVVLIFIGIIMWFGGDWPAGFLGLTGLFSLFRSRRRTGIFVYHN